MSATQASTLPPQPTVNVEPAWAEQAPIRAELCGPEHLRERAHTLAASVKCVPGSVGHPLLLKRLLENHRILDDAHRQLAAAVRAQEPLGPDAEWLLDNYYIIADVLRQVRHDLPRGYYAELPVLASGPLAGWPRVYDLAVALIAHTDSFVEDAQMVHFVQAYQEVAPLTTGELWAIPTMLRLALLENLRHLASQTLQARADRKAAADWAEHAARGEPTLPLPETPRDTFLVALQQSLRDHGTTSKTLTDWLTQHHVDSTEALEREHHRQAANQVSIGNCVTSLRLINVLDWSQFFEKVSLVERALRAEKAGIYVRQDFATRDRYRRTVEMLARGSRRPELDVAQQCATRADAATALPQQHVGWYLAGAGRRAFEKDLGYHPRVGQWARELLTDHPNIVYFGLLAFFTLSLAVGAVVGAHVELWWAAMALGLLLLLPASEIAVGLANYLVCRIVPPTALAKLDFKDGIAPDCTTFVAIPCMLIRPESAGRMLERLELHYLANSDRQLYFALLTDFGDAPAKQMPEDETYVRAALEGVRSLNLRYAADGPDRFFVFHRERQWNASENCWMGWERKRGKLHEFNRLLRGAGDTSYSTMSGPLSDVPRCRFVLTLDADTVLPRDAARQMISALAHPLSKAVLSADGRRVESGYGILQPRVTFLYRTGLRSLFARIFAGSAGLDPYASAVSDVYQDLFGQGTFTGKGLYDIDAFEATAGQAFPDNCILSHDLIESNFARCALATDIEVYDDFPAKYTAYARREHRWVRGDWQLLPWLGRRVPTRTGTATNVLPLLERWKIVDNLRRSLVPPAVVLLLALGWTVLPGVPAAWTLAVVVVLSLPFLLQVLDNALRLVAGFAPAAFLRQFHASTAATAGQALLALTFLPYQALLMLDAIVRTQARLFWTRRRMLEWETAASAERRLGDSFSNYALALWPGTAVALVLLGLLTVAAPAALVDAAPLLALWFLAPAVAFLVSRPLASDAPKVTAAGTRALRRVARKTWDFFETFHTAEDNWLPPDNFQEVPKGQVAHRTSPTNIGLSLLSCLAAHDLGFLTLPQLLARLSDTFKTMGKLERHRGHFLNWYDTQSLKPLVPAYVSTVDSGNLLGCLWALKHGLLEKLREPVPGRNAVAGLMDTLHLVAQELSALEGPHQLPSDAWHGLSLKLEELQHALTRTPGDLPGWQTLLNEAENRAVALENEARGLGDMLAALPDRLLHWIGRLLQAIRQRRQEVDAVAHLEVAGAGSPLAATVPQWAEQLHTLADQANSLATPMDFRFLYNANRNLFVVGYNVTLGRLDAAHYDLLASEACLASFLAIARGDAPRKHWFQLGRLTTRIAGRPGLVSWGGTMFEYLMPRLLLPIAPHTLLDTAQQTAVVRQMEYARRKGKPWGISESAFYYLDNAQDYQYQSFGVPGLGLKRDLGNDYVVAPYASLLAVGIAPNALLSNLKRIHAVGGEGPLGYYEAIDYTADRLPRGHTCEVVRSYMSHHQGMALLALTNQLHNNPMPRRLRAEPRVRATELLLEERVPQDATLTSLEEDGPGSHQHTALTYPVSRRLTTPNTPRPRTHLLSNGHYSVHLTNAGAGASTCNGLDVTCWRADRTSDARGQFIYVRDPRSGRVWSCGYQPTRAKPDSYEVVYSIDKAEFRRVDNEVETLLEVVVAPDKNVEIRRVTLHNLSPRPRDLELTSYAEVVLYPHAAERAHPVFCKLFLETEWVPAASALLCRRRPRAPDQKPVWGVHVVAADAAARGPASFETDRARFLGRRRSPADPAALDATAADLSGTTGPVLDPIFSLRRRVHLEPGGRAVVTFVTGVVDSREEALTLADHYQTAHGVTRAFELAWAHARLELQHLRITVEDSHLYQRLAGHVLFPDAALRARPEVLVANKQGQSGLWRNGISGDWPIVVVRIGETQHLSLLEQLLEAHSYWRGRGLTVDLVVLNEEHSGYFDELQRAAQNLLQTSNDREWRDRPGGVFLRKADHLSEEDRTLLLAAASVVLSGERGPLANQIDVMDRPRTLPPQLLRHARAQPAAPMPADELQFSNGVGGFTADGQEYVLPASPNPPPAPWINVIANPQFGFLVSDSGSGYTWAGNSQSNRLTPWNNDPVSDPCGEALYLRDENSGEVWSPTPLPLRVGSATEVRHGQGYTAFRQTRGNLEQELVLLVPPEGSVKIWRLKLRNRGGEARALSLTLYLEWVLGVDREQTGMHIVTNEDTETGALFARNAWSADFASAVAFVDVSLRPRTFTGDRTEFLGRNRGPDLPAALERVELSNRTGPGLDPCAAVQAKLQLKPNEEQTVVFVLGQAANESEARQLVKRFCRPEEAAIALRGTVKFWDDLLGTVQVQTPDQALNLLLNRWLMYQIVSCRLWGRSAFYQSGGAFGFRDQLQDVLALVHAAPGQTRQHILMTAGRQFLEGDVQHWWHPPEGRGVRTRISDDFLWLPFAVAHYVTATGDGAVLDEKVSYLKAPLLAADQEESFGKPDRADEQGTLYDHCLRALDHGWKLGPHDLPLMGTGDWNDGMNKVGAGGKGESIWNAWFQISCLKHFVPLAEMRGDTGRAELCRQRIEHLRQAVETHAWDHAWYLRAFFDDGTPLGSAVNDECRIDSLPQSWAVICGTADPERARQALRATCARLVRTDERLILLFEPPFDAGPLQPGYIKGYVPGIRENGGQYTHAATWVVQAIALLGHGTQAHALLDLLNPIRSARTPADVDRYRVEPYVLAGDVYGCPPHVGRGGWTWYPGAAGWFYRIALETLLGFQREGGRFRLDPCIPSLWERFTIEYRHGTTLYQMRVENPHGVERGVQRVAVDGQKIEGGWIDLADDGRTREVHVEMG
jgi:cyclic beta-1,2-glucan synthetase